MSTAKQNWATAFYWIGVAMALACFAFAWAGNTDLAWRFEYSGFPLSWAFAGAAIVAFLAFEFCDGRPSPARAAEERSPQLAPEWEAVES